jgi:hypothetical protein
MKKPQSFEFGGYYNILLLQFHAIVHFGNSKNMLAIVSPEPVQGNAPW